MLLEASQCVGLVKLCSKVSPIILFLLSFPTVSPIIPNKDLNKSNTVMLLSVIVL